MADKTDNGDLGRNQAPAIVSQGQGQTEAISGGRAWDDWAPLVLAVALACGMFLAGEMLSETRQSDGLEGPRQSTAKSAALPAPSATEPTPSAKKEPAPSAKKSPPATQQSAAADRLAAEPADAIYVSGSSPSERPANAPVLGHREKDGKWYARALTGIAPPYPSSMKFLEDQGNWYTPFSRRGMAGPYDIRGWHD